MDTLARLRLPLAAAVAGIALGKLLARLLRRRPAPRAPPTPKRGGALAHTVESIHLYPVKSLAGHTVLSAQLDAYGLVGDRRVMLYKDGPQPRFVTQRQRPALALVGATVDAGTLTLTWRPGAGLRSLWGLWPFAQGESISVPLVQGREIDVGIWEDTVRAYDLGDAVARWLSFHLRTPLRACWAGPGDAFRRPVDARYTPVDLAGARPGNTPPQVHFGDGYPLLLTGSASLDALNAQLTAAGAAPIPMDRFRPNVVVRTTRPYEEDRWKRVRIGSAVFAVVKGCSRCKIPTVDQDTGLAARAAAGAVWAEPLATLRETRAVGDNVYFGQNLIPVEARGEIAEGDAVHVIERGEPTWDMHEVPRE